MAEVFVNDPGTTLASSCNNSVTSITVSSATGYPSSGNFRIQIGTEFLLVTAVSGTTWTVTRGVEGTAAASHTAGDAVNAIVTAGGLDRFRSDINTIGAYSALPSSGQVAGDRFKANDSDLEFIWDGSAWKTFKGSLIALPSAASAWTVVNGASGTAAKADTSSGFVTLSSASSVLGIESMLKAIPSAPYTKIIQLSATALGSYPLGGSDVISFGVILTTGITTSSTVQLIKHFLYEGSGGTGHAGLQVSNYSNYTYSGSSSSALFTSIFSPVADRYWFQIADDNTNRVIKVSNDGVSWVTIFSSARTSPLAPTHYGIAAAYQGSGGLPWSITLIADS